MFTHKQAWRRQRHGRSSERTIRFEAAQLHESMNRSQSLPNFSAHAKQSLDYSTPRFHTMGNLNSSKDSKNTVSEENKKKKVSFSEKSKVVLIPSRGEYKKHGLANEIWWGVEDYVYFKASARLEVMDLLEKYDGNIRCALTALYQPDNHNDLMSPPSDGISTAPSACDEPNSNSPYPVAIINSISSSDLVQEKTPYLRVSTDDNKTDKEGDQPNAPPSCMRHPAPQSIQPSDLFSSAPPSGTRAPRDSLRNKMNLPPPAPTQTCKAVHPLALIMT